MGAINTVKTVLCWGLLALAVSCGGKPGLPAVNPAATPAARGPAFSAEPAEDFDPRRITVSYADQIDATALVTLASPGLAAVAADQPNACLRTRPEYEPLTDAIAARFGLAITSQVYAGRTNMAAFLLPDGADGTAIINGIRSGFASCIADVHFSYTGRLCYLPDDPLLAASTATAGPQWQIPRLNIPAAWDHTTGSTAILIATLDSGVRITHEELSATMIDPAVEFPEITADVYNHVQQMTDGYGHGTSVASLISAEGDNGRTITGVAPGCRHLPIRIAGDFGNLYDSTVVEGAYLARELDADIVSMSIYFLQDNPLIRTAMEDLAASGILLIASAGNDNSTRSQYPAGYPEVMSVGATLYADERVDLEAWGSNHGADVELAAPGAYMTACSKEADSGETAYREFGGTSAAAPVVAGCAALVWSIFPELTAGQVRQALITTGAPVTGFNLPLTRPDLEQLLSVYQLSSFQPDPLEQVLYTSTATLSLDVVGGLASARATQLSNGGTTLLTTPPWVYSFDLAGIELGMETISFETDAAYGAATQSVRLPVDNTAGSFPVSADFDSGSPWIVEVDGRVLTAGLQAGLCFIDEPYAVPAAWRAAGSGTWRHLSGAGTAGSDCYYFGAASADTYDTFELDMAVLPQIDLTGVYDGQLRFNHHYNIEGVPGGGSGDAALIVACPESTGVWEIVRHVDLGQSVFKGYQADWFHDRVLLTDYSGQRLHVGFLFNSDIAGAGAAAGQPAGWWIDDITVTAGAPKIGFARFDELGPAPYSAVGSVPGIGSYELQLTGESNVDLAVFTLDTAPLGEPGPGDIRIETGLEPFRATIEFAPELPNQLAELRITVINALGEEGQTQVIPLYIFNKPGDVNGDSLVNALDTAAIRDGLWLAAGDTGFSPVMDTDGDGIVTEADASAIGYLWED